MIDGSVGRRRWSVGGLSFVVVGCRRSSAADYRKYYETVRKNATPWLSEGTTNSGNVDFGNWYGVSLLLVEPVNQREPMLSTLNRPPGGGEGGSADLLLCRCIT